MRIVAWVKTIYGDSTVSEAEIFDFLGNMPPGKHIVGTEHGMGEIEVNAPNVDEEEFALFNVCPVGTINVEEACIADARTKPPIFKKKTRQVMRTEPDGKPVKVDRIVGEIAYDAFGKPATKTVEYTVKACPEGYVMGERTNKINIIGHFDKKIKSQGIFAKALDLGIDILEPIDTEATPRLDVKKQLVCVEKEPMPIEPKYVRLVTDSIIGWGGYAEFPYWTGDSWDAMLRIADRRYHGGAELLDTTGFAICKDEYQQTNCYLFDDKEEALLIEKGFNYYDTRDADKDAREEIIDEFIDDKYSQEVPASQKHLEEYTEITDENRYQRITKKLKEKYKQEIEEMLTDEAVWDRIERNKQDFYDDLHYNEHFLGVDYEPRRYMRDFGIYDISKQENKKVIDRIVIAEEL